MTFEAKLHRIGAAPSSPRRVERGRRAVAVVDEREQVAAHPAHVRRGDCEDRAGRNGRVGRGPSALEHGDTRRRRQVIDRGDHAARCVARDVVHD